MRSSILLTVLQAASCIAGAANHELFHRLPGHAPEDRHPGGHQRRDIEVIPSADTTGYLENKFSDPTSLATPRVLVATGAGAASGYLPIVSAGALNSSEESSVSSAQASLTSVANFTPLVPVVTKVVDVGTAQVLPSPTSLPDTSGTVQTSLVKTGQNTQIPLLTKIIASPSTTVATSSIATPRMNLPKMNLISPDIFAVPVATSAPAGAIGRRSDHPVPRLGITATGPLETNKFYAAAFLGGQTSPIYLVPYSVSWAKGQGSSGSWGMSISHIDPNQRVYGPIRTNNAVGYYINPVGIQSVVLSAAELGSSTVLTTDSLTQFSVRVSLRPSAGATPAVQFPFVIGSGFVTAIYAGAHPVINTGVFFKTVTKVVQAPKAGVVKYKLYLEDGKTWIVYARHTKGNPLDLQVTGNNAAKAKSAFYGTIQIAKDPGGFESTYDKASGCYTVGISLSGTAQSLKGTYTFSFLKSGLVANTPALMWALPHHFQTMDSDTRRSSTGLKLNTPTKGQATLIYADRWTMVEYQMPISMAFNPWSPIQGTRVVRSPSVRAAIRAVAVSEISQDMDAQANQPSMYFAGKALAKFASVCFTVNNLVGDRALAQTCLTKLKGAFSRFTQNRQQFPLVYESAWKGVVSSASYTTGNSGEDFGNTYYNDHHFHYGYHVFTAAVIGYLDPSWIPANKDWVNSLVRDYANPSTRDQWFPVSRMFDWYHGHSWAHGLFDTLDGKDQESSSEDTMSIYALKMWGMVTGDANMAARANLQLAVMSHSLDDYYLYQNNNNIQPSNFIGNKVAGILFENKVDHTTYFGTNIEYIQGIHMLPLLPHTPMCRKPVFVNQEWDTFFSNGRVNSIAGGWKGILMGNRGTTSPAEAYAFFSSPSFDQSWLDGGASRTWYMGYTAAMANM